MGIKVAGTLQSGPLILLATLSIPSRSKLPDRFSFLFDGIVPHLQKLKNEEGHNSLKLEKGINRLFISI